MASVDESGDGLGQHREGQPEQQQGEADLGREHHVDGVELRGDLGQQRQPEVGDEEHRDHRQGDLHGGHEEHRERRDQHVGRAGRRPGCSPSGRNSKVLQQPADDQQVPAGGEEQHRGQHLVELAEDGVHVHRQRVEALGQREAAERRR